MTKKTAIDQIAGRLARSKSTLSKPNQEDLEALKQKVIAELRDYEQFDALQAYIKIQKKDKPSIMNAPEVREVIRAKRAELDTRLWSKMRNDFNLTSKDERSSSKRKISDTPIPPLSIDQLARAKDSDKPDTTDPHLPSIREALHQFTTQVYLLDSNEEHTEKTWKHDPEVHRRASAKLIDYQKQMTRYFFNELSKVPVEPGAYDQFIGFIENKYERVGLDTPEADDEFGLLANAFFFTAQYVQSRNVQVERTMRGVKQGLELSDSELNKIRDLGWDVEDRIERLNAEMNELKESIDSALTPNPSEVRLYDEHKKRLQALNDALPVVKKVFDGELISAQEYALIQQNTPQEFAEVLPLAQRVINSDVSIDEALETVTREISEFTLSMMSEVVREFGVELRKEAAQLSAKGYTNDQKLAITTMRLFSLSQMLPRMCLVCTKSGEVVFRNQVYDVHAILNGQHDDVEAFKAISSEYRETLSAIQEQTHDVLKQYTGQINSKIRKFLDDPRAESAKDILAAFNAYSQIIANYSAVFGEAGLENLEPFDVLGSQLSGVDEVITKLFNTVEKAIKHELGSERMDLNKIQTNVGILQSLMSAANTSPHGRAFGTHLESALENIQRHAQAKIMTLMYGLRFSSKVEVIHTLKELMDFEAVFTKEIAKPFETDWIDKDTFLQETVHSLIQNPALKNSMLNSEIVKLFAAQDYEDQGLKALHLVALSKEPLKKLELNRVFSGLSLASELTPIQLSAIKSLLKANPQIDTIDFGAFEPGDGFLNELFNENEHLMFYELPAREGRGLRVNESILFSSVPKGDSTHYARTRFPVTQEDKNKIEGKVDKEANSGFFSRLRKNTPPEAKSQKPHVLGQFINTSNEELKAVYSSLTLNNMSPMSAYKQVKLEFKVFNNSAKQIHSELDLSPQFPMEMVLLACEQQAFQEASQWLRQLRNKLPEFLIATAEFFSKAPQEVLSEHLDLLEDFAQASLEENLHIRHEGYKNLITHLLTVPSVEPQTLMKLFVAYLGALDLANDFNNKKTHESHFEFISLLLSKEHLNQDVLNVLVNEPVFSSEYSLEQLKTTFKQGIPFQEVNQALVAHVEGSFSREEYPDKMLALSTQMALLMSNPPMQDPQVFVNAFMHYLKTFARSDLAMEEHFHAYWAHLVSNQVALSKEGLAQLVQLINELPKHKLKTIEQDLKEIHRRVDEQVADTALRQSRASSNELKVITEQMKAQLRFASSTSLNPRRLPNSLNADSTPEPLKAIYEYFPRKVDRGNLNTYEELMRVVTKLSLVHEGLNTLIKSEAMNPAARKESYHQVEKSFKKLQKGVHRKQPELMQQFDELKKIDLVGDQRSEELSQSIRELKKELPVQSDLLFKELIKLAAQAINQKVQDKAKSKSGPSKSKSIEEKEFRCLQNFLNEVMTSKRQPGWAQELVARYLSETKEEKAHLFHHKHMVLHEFFTHLNECPFLVEQVSNGVIQDLLKSNLNELHLLNEDHDHLRRDIGSANN
jgi:hypothetical protein